MSSSSHRIQIGTSSVARALCAALIAALGAACASQAASSGAATTPAASGSAHLHTYTAGPGGIFANAYILETAHNTVVVDATLTVSDARQVRARVDAIGKPLAAIFITHGHPDHYNGITELLAGLSGIPIYATAGVDRVIRQWDARKEQQWKGMFGDEWPAKRTFPDHRVDSEQSVTIDGVRFTVHDLGPGESHEDAYWIASNGAETFAFVGDLVFNGEHAYVSDGHTTEWLANLERVRAPLAGLQLYPGHGAAGGSELFDAQKAYLETFRAEVKRLSNGRPQLSEGEKAELVTRMSAYLPAGKLTFLITAGADAVAAELAGVTTTAHD